MKIKPKLRLLAILLCLMVVNCDFFFIPVHDNNTSSRRDQLELLLHTHANKLKDETKRSIENIAMKKDDTDETKVTFTYANDGFSSRPPTPRMFYIVNPTYLFSFKLIIQRFLNMKIDFTITGDFTLAH